jgi:hypothetical protein
MRGLKIEGGIVTNIAIFDEELPDGWTADPGGISIGWLDNEDGTFSDPMDTATDEEKLDEAKNLKYAQLQRAAAQEARGSFDSSVLGSLHSYTLAPEHKERLIELAMASKRHEGDGTWKRKLWCTPDGQPKAKFLEHTAQQLQELHDAVIDWLDTRQDRLDVLIDQIEAVEITTTLDAALGEVAAVTWE